MKDQKDCRECSERVLPGEPKCRQCLLELYIEVVGENLQLRSQLAIKGKAIERLVKGLQEAKGIPCSCCDSDNAMEEHVNDVLRSSEVIAALEGK